MNFYHATDPDKIEPIISNGFQLPVWHDEEGGKLLAKEGCLGVGVYISKSWQTALWFGRALLRVQLVPGTRILDVADEPDMKVINSLKREFGKEIILPHMVFHKVIPNNKQLKLNELIELTRYHYHRTWCRRFNQYLVDSCNGKNKRFPFKKFHGGSLVQCWSMLRRYKYDGFGHSRSDIGIMLLSPEKVQVKELIAVIRKRPFDRGDREFDSLDDLKMYFQKHGEKKYIELARKTMLSDV